ncbi:hypothetical protein D3OALGA1CA_3530 [Olavius algarvensis associated proteobacterium Delta 3]|nr:hypothetical protein D3OALGB2SA_3773 [Olavius algarvensis associated proteobacterium Delta 3]CAB5135827.1 hypothetical protein D3OALGA1CA_3530 [Olavius algarvensis associated proteobacterium Delta 3]
MDQLAAQTRPKFFYGLVVQHVALLPETCPRRCAMRVWGMRFSFLSCAFLLCKKK